MKTVDMMIKDYENYCKEKKCPPDKNLYPLLKALAITIKKAYNEGLQQGRKQAQ